MTAHQLREDNTAGFTLVEALAATALLGAIMAAIATITTQWMPNWNRGLSGLRQVDQVGIALERIAADLSAAEFVPIGRGSRQPFFEGTDRSAVFLRTAIGPYAEPRLEVIRIAEIAGERGPILVRTRANYVRGAADSHNQLSFRDPVILLRAPLRLSMSYAGPDRAWQKNWRDHAVLPKAVKLTVGDDASGGRLSITTTTPIRAELPAGCVGAKTLTECRATHLLAPASAAAPRPRS